jgi:hypothetical protein
MLRLRDQSPDWLLFLRKLDGLRLGISFYIAEIPILNAPQPDDDCLNHYLVGLLSPLYTESPRRAARKKLFS